MTHNDQLMLEQLRSKALIYPEIHYQVIDEILWASTKVFFTWDGEEYIRFFIDSMAVGNDGFLKERIDFSVKTSFWYPLMSDHKLIRNTEYYLSGVNKSNLC